MDTEASSPEQAPASDSGATKTEDIPPPHSPERRFVRARPRILAGVCSGMARATNTDPILWRVIVAVLVFFGGIGALLYLMGWLLLPSEEDTGSPLEALLGRGTSSTSPTSTVILSALTVVASAIALNVGFAAVALLAIGILIVGLLLRRDGVVFPSAPSTEPPPAPQWTTPPTNSTITTPIAAPVASGGFAPHGPYAMTSPPSQLPKARARKPAKASLITVGAVFCGLAILLVSDTIIGGIPLEWYAATALIITAAGMLIGSFFGKARGLIALGIISALALGAAASATELNKRVNDNPHVVRITHVTQMQDEYTHRFGSFELDLSDVQFEESRTIDIEHGVGELTVTVPENVDVKVTTNVVVGDLSVLGTHDDGFDITRTVEQEATVDTDTTLTIDILMGVGDVEVTR
ncbi:MAG: PspC domain-containing protein [Corynebacteriales bacterium]|nr:PspC domain-containing protein [Mycobacteriales bacterium]